MQQQRSGRVYAVLGVVQNVSLWLSGFVAVMLKAKPEEFADKFPSVSNAVLFVQTWAWLLVPALLVLSGFLKWLRKYLGDPAVWQELHALITRYRDEVFSDAGAGLQQHRRVTLFKHHSWCMCFRRWPWDAWLTPVVRSGHTSQISDTAFRIPRGEDSGAQGVAGKAWISEGSVYVENLPDVQHASRSDEDCSTYAIATGIDVKRVKEKKPQGRSFYAFRVEVKGKPWGVMVIDSRDTTIRKKRAKDKFDRATESFLSLLLQRI
ncbi:hypothetical protein [Lysobacter sp. FW306-1B-D06B]|uniref:hypothetical protein n=1 Tax=Lysobacter sp. FW306-1B-D06B TaxID=3140250 RepID=UPI00314088AA